MLLKIHNEVVGFLPKKHKNITTIAPKKKKGVPSYETSLHILNFFPINYIVKYKFTDR